MTAQIMHFMPKDGELAAKNLYEFIRLCREDLSVFGQHLVWESWRWPKVQFTKLGTRGRGAVDNDRLDDAFADFAKAYFRYQQGMKPTRTMNELKAIRAIEAVLLQRHGQAEIGLLNGADLDAAAQMIRGCYSKGAAYHGGRELQRMATFLSEKRLIRASLRDWTSPIQRLRDVTIQTGVEARERRERKLPPQEALDALAEIFANNPTDPRDIFTSSTFAMTLCAPVRITEVLELPVDCEVEMCDSTGQLRYGWRFYSAKGFEGDIKWIPSVMIPVAKEAVARIRKLTESARSLARWIETDPDKFFRHAACPDVDDEAPLPKDQAAEALGLVILSSAWLSQAPEARTLDSLWRGVMVRQPKGLPWLSREKRIKYSNALFCMTQDFLHGQRGTSPVILWAPTVNVFNGDLSPRESLGVQHQSIFDRYGYKTIDGERLKLTSHQARHLLNTIANRGGMTQDLIAKWCGRADARQNRVYNHMSEFEMVAEAEALDPALTLYGPDGQVSQHLPVTVRNLESVERGPLHATEFGVCVHDYVLSPCERFRDCLNCVEHVCIKGQVDKDKRIRLRLTQVEIDLAAAKEAADKGHAGADRWFEYHEKAALRLRQMVNILDSPQVPDGAQIKLRDDRDFSHLGRAINDRLGDELDAEKLTVDAFPERLRLLGKHG